MSGFKGKIWPSKKEDSKGETQVKSQLESKDRSLIIQDHSSNASDPGVSSYASHLGIKIVAEPTQGEPNVEYILVDFLFGLMF